MRSTAMSHTDPPPRPELAPGSPGGGRRWLPAGAVLGVIVIVVIGGYVTAAALSGPASARVRLGGTVSVQPLSGWELAGRERASDSASLRLTRGSGNLDVFSVPGFGAGAVPGSGGDAESLAALYIRRALGTQLERLSVSDSFEPVTLDDGSGGLRFNYVGVADTGISVEGEVTVVVTAAANGVVFDGRAPEGLLSFVDGDIDTMISRAMVR